MSDSMNKFWTPFRKGFTTCIAVSIPVFTIISGVAIYFNNQILAMKDETIKKLERSISEQENYRDKYGKENSLRLEFESRSKELQVKLDSVLQDKWREKYETERLQRLASQEKLVILE